MWSIEDVSAEQLAKVFHHYHEALVHHAPGETDHDPVKWERTPPEQKERLVAAARLALMELATMPQPIESRRRYFATPGEADWGC